MATIIAKCHLKSVSAYSQSRMHNAPKLEKESANDYENRTWIERTYVDHQGQVFIPPMAFKFALAKSAGRLRMRIPGKGQSEYGKHFLSGIIITDSIIIAKSRDEMIPVWINAHATGRRGDGARVPRCMPTVASWEGVVNFYILDEVITESVFRKHLDETGKLIGIGQFRPENGGYNGRFVVKSVEWLKQE